MQNRTFSEAPDQKAGESNLPIVDGYIELGMFDEALTTLNHSTHVATKDRKLRREIATRKVHIFTESNCFEEVIIWGELLSELEARDLSDPEVCDPEFFLHYSSALFALGRPLEALILLKWGPDEFQDDPDYHHQSAIYNVALGNVDEALEHFDTAIWLDSEIQEFAHADPDLNPLSTDQKHRAVPKDFNPDDIDEADIPF